jgi:hypothetical protein
MNHAATLGELTAPRSLPHGGWGQRPGEGFTYATESTVLQPEDLLIVSGKIDDVEAFADRT